jgi:hypothetical protein
MVRSPRRCPRARSARAALRGAPARTACRTPRPNRRPLPPESSFRPPPRGRCALHPRGNARWDVARRDISDRACSCPTRRARGAGLRESTIRRSRRRGARRARLPTRGALRPTKLRSATKRLAMSRPAILLPRYRGKLRPSPRAPSKRRASSTRRRRSPAGGRERRPPTSRRRFGPAPPRRLHRPRAPASRTERRRRAGSNRCARSRLARRRACGIVIRSSASLRNFGREPIRPLPPR